MTKTNKPVAPIKHAMTEQQQKEQIARAYFQKRASLIEAILYNMCQAPDTMSVAGEALVDRAIGMADCLMDKVYKVPEEPAE